MTEEVLGSVITNYSYDRENRLSVMQVGIDKTSYTYDGTGLRRSREWIQSGAMKTTTYVWDGTDYLGEVNSNNGNVSKLRDFQRGSCLRESWRG